MPKFRFKPNLKRYTDISLGKKTQSVITSFLAASLTLGILGTLPQTGLPAYAKNTVINQLNYETNRLIFNGNFFTDTLRPEIDTWPSEVNGQPTVVTVVSMHGDFSKEETLSSQLEQLKAQHQDILRLVAYPTTNGLFKVILEVALPETILSQTKISPVLVKDSREQFSLWLTGYQGDGEIAPHNQIPEKKSIPNNNPQIANTPETTPLQTNIFSAETKKASPAVETEDKAEAEDSLASIIAKNASPKQSGYITTQTLETQTTQAKTIPSEKVVPPASTVSKGENKPLTEVMAESPLPQAILVDSQGHAQAITRLQAEKQNLQNELNALKNETQQVTTKWTHTYKTLEQEKQALNQQNQALQEQLSTLHNNVDTLKDELQKKANKQIDKTEAESLKAEIKTLKQQLKSSEEYAAQLASLQKKLEMNNTELSTALKQVKATNKTQNNDALVDIKEKLAEQNKALSALETENNHLKTKVSEITQENQKLGEQLAQRENNNDEQLLIEAAKKITTLSNEAQAAITQNQQLTEEIAQLKNDIKKANEDKQALIIKEHYLKNAEKEQTELKTALAEEKLRHEAELKTRSNELATLTKELNQLKQKLNTEVATKAQTASEIEEKNKVLNEQIARLNQENKRLESDLDKLNISIAVEKQNWEKQLNEALKDVEQDLQTRHNDEQTKMTALSQELASLKTQLAEKEKVLSTLSKEKEQLVATLEKQKAETLASSKKRSTKQNKNTKEAELFHKTVESLATTKEELKTLQESYAMLEDRYKSLESHAEASMEANLKLEEKLEKAQAKEDKSGFNLPFTGGKDSKTLNYEDSISVITELKQVKQERNFFEKEASKMKQKLAKLEHDYEMPEFTPKPEPEKKPEPIVSNDELKTLLATLANQLKETQSELASLKQVNTQALSSNNTLGLPHTETVTALAIETNDEWKNNENPEAMLLGLMKEYPHNPNIYLKLKELYIDEKNYPEAEWVLQSLLGKNPQYHAAHYELARLYTLWHQPKKAHESLSVYKKLNPDDGNIATLERHLNKLELQSQKEP